MSVSSVSRLAGYFNVEEVATEALPDRWNKPPAELVYAVAPKPGQGRVLRAFRWGLVPPWAAARGTGPARAMINARCETVAVQPAFRSAFARRRCLVAADGFYEWAGTKPRRQPYHIARRDGAPLALAGIWEPASLSPVSPSRHPAIPGEPEPDGTGEPGEPGETGRAGPGTCVIITTPANEELARLHGRMPAVLAPEDWDAWLGTGAVGGSEGAGQAAPSQSRTGSRDRLLGLLRPAPAGLLVARQVSPLVNNVANDGPELVQP